MSADFIDGFIITTISFWAGFAVGWYHGKRYGEDTQRVADILDQWKGGWRKLPPRNVATGQFTKKEGKP